MAKEKKPLTIKQQVKRNTLYSKLFSYSEFVAAAMPYGIMAIVNREEWFALNPEPWKIGLGGGLGLALLGIALFLIEKKKEEGSKLTNGTITLVIGWYAVTFIFFLLASIDMEIYKIMAYGGMGLIACIGLEYESNKFKLKAQENKDNLKKAESKIQTEQAEKELKEEEQKKTKKQEKVVVD